MGHSFKGELPELHDVNWTKENTSRMWRALLADDTTANRFYPLDFYRVVLRELRGRLPHSGNCLDICCGTGTFMEVLAENGFECSGSDIDSQAFASIKEKFGARGRRVTLRLGDFDALPFPDEVFDAVFVSEVIEHLDETKIRKGLVEIMRVLKPSGFFAATTPNDERLLPVVCPDCLARFHPMGHIQSISPSRAAKWLSDTGFERIDARPFPTMFVYDHDPRWRGVAKRIARLILRPILLKFRPANLIFSGFRPR